MRCDRLDYHDKILKTMSPSKEKLDMSVPSVIMLCGVLWGSDAMRASGTSDVMSLGAESSRT